eukprot:scaffold293206_cov61-Attheya_sp.AAC.4
MYFLGPKNNQYALQFRDIVRDIIEDKHRTMNLLVANLLVIVLFHARLNIAYQIKMSIMEHTMAT